MSLIKLSREFFKFFPARASLVSGIPVGDGKIANIFYSVYTNTVFVLFYNFIKRYICIVVIVDADKARNSEKKRSLQKVVLWTVHCLKLHGDGLVVDRVLKAEVHTPVQNKQRFLFLGYFQR
jgi:hypothetical protein